MFIRLISAVIVVLTFSGCSSGSFGLQAVEPKLDATTVVNASNSRQTIMAALYSDASFGVPQTDPTLAGKMPLSAVGSASWYETTLAGFNFVDDQCSAYFSQLYELERNSRATVAGLGAFAQTASAILAVTGADVLTITSVAQAFGLATSLTEITANSFLYRLPPAATRGFVRSTMGAYRSAVASEAKNIDNPALAYSYIRGYLDLCLPVTIEGMLVDTVSSVEATPGAAAGGRVDIGLSSTAGASAALEAPASTQQRLAPVPPRIINVAEESLSPIAVAEIQTFLCFDGSAVDGRIGQNTRQAMAEFFEGLGDPNPQIATGRITAAEIATLRTKIDRDASNTVKTCEERGFSTPREVGRNS